ncbi:hypothetical protein ACIBH1_46775 [Nonomuraea sp. NPDC050663]|uniref:hypothetical protein n=1 Tax=Nonomuraea sp. NPDC050663 TaxID=3364370 RepID=UPI0037A86607
MKIIRSRMVRLFAVSALAASFIAVGIQNAHAAIRIFPATGGTCVGTEVLRCLELRYDDANERYRARAEITDVAGGSDAAVEVDLACAGPVGGTGDCNVGDPPGEPVKDTLESPFESCRQGDIITVRFSAEFSWRNIGTGATGSERRTGSAHFTCT